MSSIAMGMSRSISIAAGVLVLSAGVAYAQPCPEGEWCQWTEPEGGNDHWYRLVEQEEPWDEANANAGRRGGYLVTIMSVEENEWLITQFASAKSSNNALWTGFYQDTQDKDYSEPDHGWKWFSDPEFCRWSTGYPDEDPCYTNWRVCCPAEPNDSPVGDPPRHQNCTQWYTTQNPGLEGLWDDQYCDIPVLKSIIERDTDPSVPTVSEWGMVVMTLLVLTAGTVVLMRRRRSAT